MTQDSAGGYPCPACRTWADLTHGCPGCGRGPDPAAAEVVRLNAAIAELTGREQRGRRELAEVVRELTVARQRREWLTTQIRATLPSPSAPPPPPADHGHGTWTPPAVGPATAAARQPEMSTFGVQTLLFVIGGLLLGTGAIVFTVVAWTRFGLLGQAATLLIGTALALAAPAVARWRRLFGTAETLAVIGVLLVLLDGYAAWRGGLVDQLAPTGWAAAVSTATALIALGYSRLTGLASPRFAALVLAQPVLPLLAVEPLRQLPGWEYQLAVAGYLAATVAAGNLALVYHLRRPRDHRSSGEAVAPAGSRSGNVPSPALVLGWLAVGGWTLVSALAGGLAVAAASTVGSAATAGGALLVSVAVFAVVARLAGGGGWSAAATAAAVLATLLALGRVLAAGWSGYALVAVAALVAAATVAARFVPAGPVRRGWRIGALVGFGVMAAWLVGLTGWAAMVAVGRALHWPARLSVTEPYDWQLPVALVLLVAALLVLPRHRSLLLVVGGALLALAVPSALALPWWAPVSVGLPVIAAAGLVAASATATRLTAVAGVTAGLLAGYALLVSVATVVSLAAVLAGLVLIAMAVAVRARPVGEAPLARRVIGQVGLLVGLVGWPATVAAMTAAAGAAGSWPGRAAAVAVVVLLPVVVLVRRWLPGYTVAAAAAVHVATPVAVVAGFAEGGLAVAWYAAGAVLVLAVLGLARPPSSAPAWLVPRLPVAALPLVLAVPQLVTVLLAPYGWLGNGWSGAPSGVGLTVGGDWPAAPAVVWGLMLLTAAAGVGGWVCGGLPAAGQAPAELAARRRWRSALAGALLVAPVAMLVGLAEWGAPWPALPAVSLLWGTAAVGWATLRRVGPGRSWTGVGVGYGLVLAGAGLAGALPTRWSTLVALGFALVVATVVAVAGRAVVARVVGWFAAVTSGVLLAVAAATAADTSPPVAGLGVLAVAALALAASALDWRGRLDRLAAEAAAQAAALVALLVSISDPARAAVVAVLWGAALGVRALRRDEPVGGRVARVVAATGCQLLAWWLLLTWWQVAAVEAYTVPAALLAAVAGGAVRRTRPTVSSWFAYGPALVTALLPTLALSLADPAPLRRLLLGIAAVVILLAGARGRLQAPVVVGGCLAVLVAVRELALVWQRLDAWIPLTVAGLLLVGLAAAYERRRRDLSRLRAALGRLT